jgi:hypothetical protein
MNADRDVIAAIRNTESLADLQNLLETSSEHDAYLRGKKIWTATRRTRQPNKAQSPGLPGDRVQIDDQNFYIHGVTHTGTDEERTFLRDHTSRILEGDATVYCEQGIRPLYFDNFPQVTEMDDYRWATADRPMAVNYSPSAPDFNGIRKDISSLTGRLRDAVFELVVSGERVYGNRIARGLGSALSAVFGSHEQLATGDDFESFRLRRCAVENPRRLIELQRYYDRAFLPQPLEREWLRRHNPRLEKVSHARNERMADYAIHHNDTDKDIHLIVGAAHGPGIRYYLEAYRDNRRTLPSDFQFY